MALVTIAGFPCSGKSRRAHQLAEDFKKRLAEPGYSGPALQVVVVDDESSHVPRSSYDDSKQEKPARANLFTGVTRSLGPETIVICDSANYIKGFRYQMYVAAREAHSRVCTVHVATPPEKCREWHSARGAEQAYKPETFDNMIMRFEEPNSMVRWDSPLYTIAWDEDPPYDAIWQTITTGSKAPPTAAVANRSKPAPNALAVLTGTTSSITTGLVAHLNATPTASSYNIPASSGAWSPRLVIHLPVRRVTLSEMQRLKRQFEAVQTRAIQSGGLAAGSWTENEVASKFVSFLEIAWET